MTSGKADDESGNLGGKVASSIEVDVEDTGPQGSRVRPSEITAYDTPLSTALDTPPPAAKTRPSNAPPQRDAVLPERPDITPLEGMPKVSDTLLSAPAPADRLEVMLEDRLTEFQHRIDILEERLHALEKRPVERTQVDRSWWVWVAFLLVLAVGWQLLGLLK